MIAPEALESWNRRLRELKGPVPDGLVERARAAAARPVTPIARTARRHHVRTGWVIVAVAIVALVANGAAVYFLPSYASALGHVPGAGALLKWSGLSGTDVSVLYSTSEHDGVRLTVTAGYADGDRTLLTVEVYGPGARPGTFDSFSLTDQFGKSYVDGGSALAVTNSSDGGTPDYLEFAPISGPAAAVGARLTLQAENWSTICGCNSATNPRTVRIAGTWRVTFVLQRQPAAVVRWPSGAVDGLWYTFPSVTITSGKLVEIHVDAQGPVLPASIFSAPGVPAIQAPKLLDSLGRAIEETRLPGVSLTSGGDNQSQVLDYILRPGQYRLFVYGLHGSSLERELIVR